MIEVKIRKMKKTMLTFGILLLSIFLVSANSIHQEMFEEGKKLIDSKLSCDTLTDEQLESIGEYYWQILKIYSITIFRKLALFFSFYGFLPQSFYRFNGIISLLFKPF